MKLNYIIFFSTLLIIACQPLKYEQKNYKIESTHQTSSLTDSIIKPYKEALDTEMKEVLCWSDTAMEKGQPESLLGNWVADLSFQYVKDSTYTNPHFCLLNNGGLRTSIPKGVITRERIFSLMPFENELVIITISKEKFNALIDYLIEVGGQPVSNIVIHSKSKNNKKVEIKGIDIESQEEFKIVTTDYLAKGGDKMTFFLNPIEITYTNTKLRDVIIHHCINMNLKGIKISSQLDNRIVINE